MIIYGSALLAACHLLGIFLGDLLGHLLGVKTNRMERREPEAVAAPVLHDNPLLAEAE
jgi:hypothetical protein